MADPRDHLLACLPRLRRYARALTGERCSADDLVQDTVERGWSRLSQWRANSDMRPWLFSIMHNLHMDQMRRAHLPAAELDEAQPASTPSPASARLELRDVQTALALLPAEQREVLLLVALEEMTYEEVAGTLGIPLGTVMSRLSRGRERLRLLMLGQALPSPLKVVK
jgi:RNA polymerase sigma-70 factor (ECF subfamily)